MCRATAGLATTKTYQAPNKPALHGNKGDYRDFFESCRALKVTPSCGPKLARPGGCAIVSPEAWKV